MQHLSHPNTILQQVLPLLLEQLQLQVPLQQRLVLLLHQA
jgi:hypothetical protein